MKKWQLISLVSAIAVAILVICGVLVYRYYLTPKYIEPIVTEISEIIKKEEVLDELYEEAVDLHESGVIEDETYSNFVRAYNDFKRDDVDYARQVIEKHEAEDTLNSQNNSLSTKYASYKVGVETIQVNDGEANGKADVQYSDERTSERIKADDVVEAERILEEAENGEPIASQDPVRTAYEKLRANMESGEFSTFTSIMKQLDIESLKMYVSDKEGLKAYLHSMLSDDDYASAVNLGYKYVHVFIDEK